MELQSIRAGLLKKVLAASLFSLFLLLPAQGFAEQTLYPAENPMPNGAYIMCTNANLGACYDLREQYNNTNTQVEHVADRLLLRSDNTGYFESFDEIIPLSWQAPDKNRVIVKLQTGTTWNFAPEGAFLKSGDANFIFVRSEREYEDTDGGEVSF